MKNEEIKTELLYCSFCGKSQEEAKILIGGYALNEGPTKAYICDECIKICIDIIFEGALEQTEE